MPSRLGHGVGDRLARRIRARCRWLALPSPQGAEPGVPAWGSEAGPPPGGVRPAEAVRLSLTWVLRGSSRNRTWDLRTRIGALPLSQPPSGILSGYWGSIRQIHTGREPGASLVTRSLVPRRGEPHPVANRARVLRSAPRRPHNQNTSTFPGFMPNRLASRLVTAGQRSSRISLRRRHASLRFHLRVPRRAPMHSGACLRLPRYRP